MDRATFEIGREPPKDDGLRQIEPDDELLQWVRDQWPMPTPPKPEPRA